MSEFVQLTPDICVPIRTAELASKFAGVQAVLQSGIDVKQYLDRREEESSPEAGQIEYGSRRLHD